jgi:hypothetical protein
MINFQGVSGGVGYNDTASDQDSRRRNQLAQLMLQQGNAASGVGVTGALNKILSGAIAGWQMGKDSEEQKARGDARNDTLADALRAGQGQAAETRSYGDGTEINWNEKKGDANQMAAILAGNRDTAPMGMQMQIGQMDEKRKNETATAAALRKVQTDRESKFWEPIKTDDGSIIIPAMMPGFQMQGQAPRAAPATPAPQAPGVDMRTAQTAPNPPPVEQQQLAAALARSESGGKPGVVNKEGYSGKYQFGEAAATEAGFYTPDDNPNDNKWNGTFKNLPGVGNYQDFLKNEGAQDQAFGMHQTHLSAEIDGRGLDKYIGQTVGGVPITRDGLVAMMHLGGPGGTEKFLKSNGQYNPADSGGTKLSDYGAKFAGGGAQPPAPPQGVQVADASGAIPASAMPPGMLYQGRGKAVRTLTADEVQQNGLPKGTIAQIDPTGKINVLNKGEGGGDGGLFGGPAALQQNRNLYIKLQTKMANGETLTPQEKLAMELIQQDAQQPRTIVTDTGVQTVTPPPLPTMQGRQPAPVATPAPAPATDTVPNPLQQQVSAPAPAAAPPAQAPAAPNQPTIATIQSKVKPIPEKIQAGMLENVNAIRKVDETIAAITKTPSATGFGVGALNAVAPNAVTNFAFPEGTEARALISEIGSMKIHDRAGASQTAGEMENLKPFIPKMSDSDDEIRIKLKAFRNEYMNMLNDTASAYSAETGYQINPVVAETIKTGRAASYKAPLSGEDPNKPRSALSGASDADILKQLGM